MQSNGRYLHKYSQENEKLTLNPILLLPQFFLGLEELAMEPNSLTYAQLFRFVNHLLMEYKGH